MNLCNPASIVAVSEIQAAEASASWLNTAFSALTESLKGQRQQLKAFASQQHAASSAMLQHTHSAIALARQHLHEAGAATTTCQQNVDHTLSAQSSALSAFDEGFACSMQEDQVCASALHHFPWVIPGDVSHAQHTPLMSSCSSML